MAHNLGWVEEKPCLCKLQFNVEVFLHRNSELIWEIAFTCFLALSSRTTPQRTRRKQWDESQTFLVWECTAVLTTAVSSHHTGQSYWELSTASLKNRDHMKTRLNYTQTSFLLKVYHVTFSYHSYKWFSLLKQRKFFQRRRVSCWHVMKVLAVSWHLVCCYKYICHEVLRLFTWVEPGDASGASEHLPAQRGILTSVLDEDSLQRLSPVQFIQDCGSCRQKCQTSKTLFHQFSRKETVSWVTINSNGRMNKLRLIRIVCKTTEYYMKICKANTS